MFLRRCFVRTYYCRRFLLSDRSCLSTTNTVQHKQNFCFSFNNSLFTKTEKKKKTHQNITYAVLLQRKHYCKGITDIDSKYDKEITKIKELFSQPRVTLNELASKTPEKVFDVHYKQMVNTPKGSKKKAVLYNDWCCTYSFVWPEKMKFESTAISKRQAAEKAATQAVHWLYTNKRIDSHGNPRYNKVVLNEIRSTINKPIYASISQNSIDRIERIWEDYETEIKSIYEATFKTAKQKLLPSPAILKKDSTIDEEDYPEDTTQVNEPDDVLELKTHIHPVFGKMFIQPTEATMERRDRILKNKFQDYEEGLVPLPIDQYAEQIVSTLETSRVAVIVGAAGCGKSTRVPAAILRHCGAATAAVVSEPRRVAAIGLAQRVADELGEQVGESIGYQVRLHAKPPRPPGGAVLYCTSGVLLKRLQLNPGLEGCSHVFIDEAHERDVNTDITLLLLKRALDINPKLKVVVMSATLDTEVFTRYFDPCPVIEVPGRTFPVSVLNLKEVQTSLKIKLPFTMENCQKEDQKPQVNCQEVAEVIKAVDKKQKEGAILVFLPGWGEIKQTKQILDEHYGKEGLHMILPVHSRLSTTDQTKMFTKPLPGVRKIVLATNIAETSITIPDVVYVVDAGAHKENRIKEGTGTASLEKVWVSLAGAKQRTGRAGRVQPGICYRLYTEEKEAEFAPHTTPEILRIPLEQTVLDCKTYAPDDKVESFLSQLPEPPTKKAIDFAVKDLIEIGALSKTEQLTRLGAILSSLSLHPRLGRCVLHAAVVGNVVAAANVATHCSDSVELFRNAADRRDEIRDIKRKFSPVSDHAAFHWIQEEFERTVQERGWQDMDQWCDKYGLRKDRLGYVKALSNLHLEQLFKSGFIEADPDVEELNRFSELDEFTSTVLLSGSDSLLVTKKYVKTKGKLATVTELFTSTGDRAHIGSESVNYNIKKQATATTSASHLLSYFGGHHSAERRALLVHRSSLLAPHAALLFAGGHLATDTSPDSDGETSELCLRKHKLKIQMPTRQADLILKAREMLWNTFQYYIDRDVRNLNEDHTTASRFKVRLIKAIGRILVEGEREYLQVKRSEEDGR